VRILLEDVNAKVGREDILKPAIENKNLHEINNDNGFRMVNFTTLKDIAVKNAMFPHHTIHK
jgi:hypothetical protein